jgi:ribosomal protein S7
MYLIKGGNILNFPIVLDIEKQYLKAIDWLLLGITEQTSKILFNKILDEIFALLKYESNFYSKILLIDDLKILNKSLYNFRWK